MKRDRPSPSNIKEFVLQQITNSVKECNYEIKRLKENLQDLVKIWDEKLKDYQIALCPCQECGIPVEFEDFGFVVMESFWCKECNKFWCSEECFPGITVEDLKDCEDCEDCELLLGSGVNESFCKNCIVQENLKEKYQNCMCIQNYEIEIEKE